MLEDDAADEEESDEPDEEELEPDESDELDEESVEPEDEAEAASAVAPLVEEELFDRLSLR